MSIIRNIFSALAALNTQKADRAFLKLISFYIILRKRENPSKHRWSIFSSREPLSANVKMKIEEAKARLAALEEAAKLELGTVNLELEIERPDTLRNISTKLLVHWGTKKENLTVSRAAQTSGRQELPADLPRVEQIMLVTPQQCVCGNCGKERTLIGYESAEQLDVEPSKYFVRVTKREKRACKACEEQGVECAPLPPRIIEKGLASDRVVVDTVVSKYADFVPLYRQSAILERENRHRALQSDLDVG